MLTLSMATKQSDGVCRGRGRSPLLYLTCELASTEPQCIIKLAENLSYCIQCIPFIMLQFCTYYLSFRKLALCAYQYLYLTRKIC